MENRSPASHPFPAHIRLDGTVQTVAQHCRDAAEIASRLLEPLRLGRAGYLAGLVHDMGKLKDAYAQYISDAAAGKPVRRGSVNHTFTGVKYLLDAFHTGSGSFSDVACELLAYAVGAHHGLFDAISAEGRSEFDRRRAYDADAFAREARHFAAQCMDQECMEALFAEAAGEIEAVLKAIFALPTTSDDEAADQEILFYIGLLARLMLSAVIEGDRRDTAIFMGARPAGDLPDSRAEIWARALESVERHIGQMPGDTPVNAARHAISRLCRDFAPRPAGLYRLNVPTGGGKTLSGLRFALAHAKQWNRKRVFYVAPLITILEQNAEAIRRAVGRDEWVLEHHSNVIREAGDAEELERLQLLEEDWEAPIVVTTLVQLLNTLFSAKTACVRRFHALADSVILIDEVQTVPSNMISLFNLAMNFLTGVTSATVLLCSATQPRFEQTRHALRIETGTPVPHSDALWQPFRRTHIQDAGGLRLEEIPALVKGAMARLPSLLLVCNKKSEAMELYQGLQGESWRCFHLSASMCVAHRREVLSRLYAAIEQARAGGPRALCVSTQLIEAGVDISFDGVVRLSAGMDSVVQSAGRCNRNGESAGASPVWLVRCENEKLTELGDIQRGKSATDALLYAFRRDPGALGNDLASEQAIRFYYDSLYRELQSGGKNRMDYPVEKPRTTLLDLLSENLRFASKGGAERDRYTLRQAFRTAGELFSVFDDDASEAIVPWGEGRDIIQRLMGLDARWHLGEIGELLRRARPYTVSIYTNQVQRLLKQGMLFELCGGKILALADGYYSDETGLIDNPMTHCFLEV